MRRLIWLVVLYLTGELPLSELENWVVPGLPVLFHNPESPEAGLAGCIELGLAEISDGAMTEDEFRVVLKKSLRENKEIWEKLADS